MKKTSDRTVDNELMVILSHGDIKIFMSSMMYNDLKNHADELSQAFVRICLCKDDVDCNVSLGNDLFRQVDVQMQDKVVSSEINICYPYKAMMDVLLRY